MGNNLMSWLSGKKNFIPLSTAEAKYIIADSCCTQLFWMKQMLNDYVINQNTITMLCDNTSVINISKNYV